MIEKEIENGVIPDPNAMVDPMTGRQADPGMVPAPEATPDAMQAPTSPKDPERRNSEPSRWYHLNICCSNIF